MNISTLLTKTGQTLKSNSPEILTALGVAGVVTTAYLVGKAAYEAAFIISANEQMDDRPQDAKERFKYDVKHTWRLYIPAGVSGAVTIGCIVGASKGHANRTTAAVTAYTVADKAFSEYKEKVVEQIGKGKEQKIRDEIAQDRTNKSPNKQVLVAGSGQVLCCEMYTMRYFLSDMETLRRAQNDVNAKVVSSLYVVLDEFYYIVGLSSTTDSGKLGWDSNRLMDLHFSTVLNEGGIPCLAFEYNYVKPIK